MPELADAERIAAQRLVDAVLAVLRARDEAAEARRADANAELLRQVTLMLRADRIMPMLLDRQGAAAALGVSVSTLHELVRAGELTPLRVGTAPRFAVHDLRDFLLRLKSAADSAARVSGSTVSASPVRLCGA